ncbi:MAG: ABC transporter substrate-binding protein [Rickettsiales bacterium]|nr:ABC transporter substrate-binding protein [Rickettsiales bacterium]
MSRIFTYFTLILLCTTVAKANNDAELYIKNFTNDIFNIITDNQANSEDITPILSDEIKKNIDLRYICKFVIGRYWQQSDSNFKETFSSLYERFLIRTYAPQFKGYNGENYKIVRTTELRPNRYSSHILFFTQDKTQLNIVIYFVRNQQQQFKIVDVTGEGISLIASQREEFSSIISNYGLDYFLKSFQDRVKNLENNT